MRIVKMLAAVLLALIGALAANGGCAARPAGFLSQEEMGSPALRPQGSTVAGVPAIPGALPSASEELWVIEKPGQARPDQPRGDDVPGAGALMAKRPGDTKDVPVPLKHTDVKASIAGYIATVDVTQQYQNPYDTKIEAVYIFPLPHNAAVNEFLMTIGERKIRGIIRERAEAERIYQAAKAQGYVASLLTQERPNIFTQSVANIEPGKAIDINIKFFHTLAYVDGWYEWAFPMVVGPRFNPPGMSDGIGAVGRDARGASGQKTEVAYLKPAERSGHDISLLVQVDAGVAIEKIESRNHQVAVETPTPQRAVVKIAAGDAIPNKDFVLRYKVAGKTTKSAFIAQRGRGAFPQTQPAALDDNYFTLMLYPPEQLNNLPRQPLELVFVIDVSGSQDGAPLAQEKAATLYALKHMGPQDTFQVIRFSDHVEQLSPSPLAATRENVARALNYVESLSAGGGTMLVDGLRAALEFPHDESRLRFVCFMTDGFIGNEAEALRELHRLLGPARIFSFGVGSSTNRYLLDAMARMGNGAVAYLGLKDNAQEVMDQFFARISHPALSDIAIDWGGMEVSDVYPARAPDLFVGRPAIVTGRFKGKGDATIRIKGMAGGERQQMALAVKLDDPAAAHRGVAAVWARMKIADLSERSIREPSEKWPEQIKQIALGYGLMSPFTAFVAVDASAKTAGDFGVSVPVPVPVPDGVKYETTVGEK